MLGLNADEQVYEASKCASDAELTAALREISPLKKLRSDLLKKSRGSITFKALVIKVIRFNTYEVIFFNI